MNMIPKIIWTYWLNDEKPLPDAFVPYVESQKLLGYEHHVITLENCECSDRYYLDAIKAKRWVKASDYVRMWYLLKYGGTIIDADMSVLEGKNFDDLLNCRMFTGPECTGLAANAGMGAEPNHLLVAEYLRRVDENYKGDGELVFEPGIRTWNDVMWAADKQKHGVLWYDSRMFFPYNHVTGQTDIQPFTKVMHFYSKSWVKPLGL